MKTYKITALKMGTLVSDKGGLTRGKDNGVSVEIPVWATAIEGHGIKAIVDTGIHDVSWVENNICPCWREPDETMEGALEAIGWKADDVNIVINTHYHYDHCGNNSLFKKATFYVSKKEKEGTYGAIPLQAVFYLNELFDSRAVNAANQVYLEGEHHLAEGIVIIPTPGHSKGHQSVLVNTEDGVVAITGDAANMVENITENIAPNIQVSTVETFKSLEEFRRKAQFVITGHEPSIQKFQTKDFPCIQGDKKFGAIVS